MIWRFLVRNVAAVVLLWTGWTLAGGALAVARAVLDRTGPFHRLCESPGFTQKVGGGAKRAPLPITGQSKCQLK